MVSPPITVEVHGTSLRPTSAGIRHAVTTTITAGAIHPAAVLLPAVLVRQLAVAVRVAAIPQAAAVPVHRAVAVLVADDKSTQKLNERR